MFTDINIYHTNNKTDPISEKYIFYIKKSWYFPDFKSDLEQDPDPDQLFHETDPRIQIRIHIKMKLIRNTAANRWCQITPRNWIPSPGKGSKRNRQNSQTLLSQTKRTTFKVVSLWDWSYGVWNSHTRPIYYIIKASALPTIICTDSKPVMDAAKLLQTGKYSSSPRMLTFINKLGKIKADVEHISGKSWQNNTADYQPRNTMPCNADICQLCSYVQSATDTIIDPKIGYVSSSEIPYYERKGWTKILKQDHACIAAYN